MDKPKTIISCFLLIVIHFFSGCSRKSDFPVLSGSYLGQSLPGLESELFAPGLVSTGLYERDMAISSDGKEIYYGLILGGRVTIMMSRLEKDSWTEPKVAPFASNPDALFFEPCVSHDGKRLFFLSTLPPKEKDPKPGWGHQNIWVVNRTQNGDWGEPQDVGPPVNTENAEYFPSLTLDGTLYFTRSIHGEKKARIMRSRNLNGAYAEPEPLPEPINGQGTPYNAYIAPDESFLIACVEGRDDSVTPGYPDYYVFFRRVDDTWSDGINLGNNINIPEDRALSPYVSPDGKYYFFASARKGPELSAWREITWSRIMHLHVSPKNGNSDIYWVDARIIENLKPEGFE
ncbi:hypothetical protein ACFLT2_05210 [Acidobacteriota bacterium]